MMATPSAASAAHRARRFETAAVDPLEAADPPPERSALAEWNSRPPPKPHSIAINPKTNGAAVLAKVMAEPAGPDREANAELRTALGQLGISQTRLARLLGCNARTARHWTLDRPPPCGVVILIRLLVAKKISIRSIEQVMDAP
jgi:hypothetical protein